MPGLNGTGPRGQGPFTGRGRGYCIEPVPFTPKQPQIKSDIPMPIYPYGRGRGLPPRGPFGRGRGFGWWNR